MTAFNFRSFANFLKRNKLYTAINVFGFSVSLMFVILISAYTVHELSADRFHAQKDRIFLFPDMVAYPVGQDLKNRYPEIENYTLVNPDEKLTLTYGEGKKVKAHTMYVDSSFFSIFSFPLVEGDPRRALETANNAVVTESFAKKLYGNESPVGKTVVTKDRTLHITGVAADFRNSIFRNPDIIVSTQLTKSRWLTRYNNCCFYLFVQNREHTDIRDKKEDMLQFFKGYFWPYKEGMQKEVKILPVQEAYLADTSNWDDTDQTGYGLKHGNREFIWILFSVGILILVFAVINYINLSIAQTGFRAREMATRRLLGGSRRQLFRSLITESALLCLVSSLIGLLFAFAAEGIFDRVLNTDLLLSQYLTAANLAGFVLFIALLGITAGFIPASVISSFKPIEAVRGTFTRKTKMVYSKILISFQYFITITLIGCTIVMIRQVRHLVRTDPGYRTENIVDIRLGVPDDSNAGQRFPLAQTLKNEFLKIGGVTEVSMTVGSPIDAKNNETDTTDPNKPPVGYQVFWVDSSFLRLTGIRILRDNHNESGASVWLNESAYRANGLSDDALTFKLYGSPLSIAGRIEDFHYRDLTQTPGPVILLKLNATPVANTVMSVCLPPENILVKIVSEDPAGTLGKIRKTFDKITGGEPFEAEFFDASVQQWYEAQQRMTRIIGYLSLMAIVISTLGLLAMSSYFIRQRSMEIAIRKVYGSTSREVLEKMLTNFMRMVAVGFVVAVPAIWYIMRQWLDQYTSKISLNWLIFAAAGLIAAAIAFATVYWQSRKAAHANPVDSVKK